MACCGGERKSLHQLGHETCSRGDSVVWQCLLMKTEPWPTSELEGYFYVLVLLGSMSAAAAFSGPVRVTCDDKYRYLTSPRRKGTST